MKKNLFLAVLAAALMLCSCVAINAPGEPLSEAEKSMSADSAASFEQSRSAVSDDSSAGSVESEETLSRTEEPVSSEDTSPVFSYNIDITPYLQYINVSDLLLVNKQVLLTSDYVPRDLVDITYTRTDRQKEKMVPYAEKALRAFLEEAHSFGYKDVTVTSGYRSYGTQEWLFNYYVENEMKNGKTREQAEIVANTYSARPGTSEHQSGLCVDMHNLPSADQSFGDTEAGKWLAANAHRFGFILRFPKGKEEITGYSYEPWHFRFVGIEHAAKIYAEGLCLEEYLQKYFPDAAEQNR